MTFSAQVLNSKLPYLFSGEIEYLETLARSLHDGAKVCILGAGPGLCSLSLLQGNPTLNIIAVDNNPTVIKSYEAHLHAAGFSSYVVCGDTVGVLQLIENDFDNISLLIVDANHSAESVFNDIKAYWPKVSIGGYVFFHDYEDLEQNDTNGVATAVHEYLDLISSCYEFIGTPGISYVVRKTRS